MIGYFCSVSPQGYIIVSLYKVLAPVKAYSDTSDLDPYANYGMADLIKSKMGSILEQIESQVGSLESANLQEVDPILEINYAAAWRELSSSPLYEDTSPQNNEIQVNYSEGDVLLDSSWHQESPYNDDAPMGDGDRTLVGCVATAGAQIMTYWGWPPTGQGSSSYIWSGDDSCNNPGTAGSTLTVSHTDAYDWPHIANRYNWDASDGRWEDGNGDELTQTWLDAVSELNYEVGVAVNMDFGACVSESYTYDMEAVFEDHFRYNASLNRVDRVYYTAAQWFELLKDEFNANRPVQYRVKGHSIVGDGWQEIGETPTKQYHMNYGWDNFRNGWYTLDALHLGGVLDEYMLRHIYPDNVFSSIYLYGDYPPQTGFNYRYIYLDSGTSEETYTGPQSVQFLPGVSVFGWGDTHGLRFENSSDDPLILFTDGDQNLGVHISKNGGFVIKNHGEIRFFGDGR